MPIINNQTDEWQIQGSKRKKNNQRKTKKNQKYLSKDQIVNKSKRENACYYQNTKKSKDQNGNKNKSGKRSNKFDNKIKKQNREKDNILDSIPIERNKNLNIIKSTSLLKIQIEQKQNCEKDVSLDLKSKDLLLPKKTISEMSDVTAVSITSLASDSNSITSSTLTQTNSLKDNIVEHSQDAEVIEKNNSTKNKYSETTLLKKCFNTEKVEVADADLKTENSKDNEESKEKELPKNSKEIQSVEEVKKLEDQCSVSSSSSVTSFDSSTSSKSSNNHYGDDNESVITAKNDAEDLKITENKNKEIAKNSEEKKVDNKKDDMTKKVLEFNFKNYTDVQPFIPKHLKAQKEQVKVEIVAPKPQNAKQNTNTKGIIERKHDNESITSKRKTKEINKIIRIDPSCLHQKDGHIVPIAAVMKNGKNFNSNNVQEILQRNIQQKTNELQESKKKKYEELRKLLDRSDKDKNNKGTQSYQSLPVSENNTNNGIKKEVTEKPQVRKIMSNSVLEVSSTNKIKKVHQRTSSYTMNRMNSMQKNIPNLVESKDDYLCSVISPLAVSNRIENEYNNVKCYNDPMEQSLTRVKPASIKRSRSVQNITTLSRKGSNHQLLLGGNGSMTVTNTITTCKTTPRLRSSKSFSLLRRVRSGLENTHVTTINTTTTTSHSSTLYTNLVGSSSYYPIVVLPTASVQEMSVETTTRKLRTSNSLPNMMGKLIRKLAWPFGGSNLESEVPLSVESAK
ncbi:hypothetical protein BCR36DRAFT_581791 [Piromyces finnis]|uniref:Uncharacterized protein n=1 Tax=Piromyces finnis TaxID=1754191 RepID=A0A1Y1VGK7_9FUNG|nr:hypothetical protein BCR36DRAFT_581791 [Piromyces finnis]|eukprot:ORX54902.1 hypothetical protein BCR36DRAFT_581791 [Piromyces finnis]